MNTQDLERFLKEQIPLTNSLEVSIVSLGDNDFELRAPLAPNHNHMGSAFGGSLSALLILAGYTWLYHYMRSQGFEIHVILKSNSTNFTQPVEEDIRIRCLKPEQGLIDKFMDSFSRKGLARINLRSEIITTKGVAATFEGEFVAKADAKSAEI